MEVSTIDQQREQGPAPGSHAGDQEIESPRGDWGERATYPARLRMFVLLSIVSWGVVVLAAVAIIWAIRRY